MNANQRQGGEAGLIDAGAGWLKWDFQQNKYVWINKSSPLKRKPGNPAVAGEVGEKRVKHAAHKIQGKKAIRQPLGIHNAQQRKSKSPVKQQRAVSHRVNQPAGGRAVAQVRPSQDKVTVHGVYQNVDDSSFLEKIQKGHSAMTNVLQARHLKISAAKSLWKSGGVAGLVSYLVKCNDDSVVADFLPLITTCIKDEKVSVSLGACQELLPVLNKLLYGKYEDYINKTLDLLRAILKQWWKDLSTYDENASVRMLRSQNIPSVYSGIVQMSDVINKLSEKPGSIGERARLVSVFLRQM